MAHKYEVAYTQLFDMEKHWRKEVILAEPLGRHADELSRMCAILAEKGEISARECYLGDVKYDPNYMHKMQLSGVK